MTGKGGAITLGAESLWGRRMIEWAPKKQQCHTHIFQYSTFASGIPQVQKWGRRTCILPRAPS